MLRWGALSRKRAFLPPKASTATSLLMTRSYFYFVKSLLGVCEINFADNWFRDKSRNPGSGARDSSRALSARNLFRRKTTPLPIQASAFLKYDSLVPRPANNTGILGLQFNKRRRIHRLLKADADIIGTGRQYCRVQNKDIARPIHFVLDLPDSSQQVEYADLNRGV